MHGNRPFFISCRLPVRDGYYHVKEHPNSVFRGKLDESFEYCDSVRLGFPLFAFDSNRKAIWASILEKAYAKYFGQYGILAGTLETIFQ